MSDVPSQTIKPRAAPIYLDDGAGPVFGFLHPASSASADTAVVICPPFGWDEVCSYRSRWAWAEHLAAGVGPTLRVDLPGTGDSAGSLLELSDITRWADVIAGAASWLRATTDATTLVTIGLGFGGLVACASVAGGAPIDEVVLWATPSGGRAFLRELRAFAQFDNAWVTPPGEPPVTTLAPGTVGAGGYAVSEDAASSIGRLDAKTLRLPSGRVRRALLLGRDGVSVDARVQAMLAGAGADVTLGAGHGYNAMIAPPQEATAPSEVFTLVDAWLGEREHGAHRALAHADDDASDAPSDGISTHARRAGVGGAVELELDVGGVAVREMPVAIDGPGGALFGVLASASGRRGELCAVLLNAGMIHRSGPNRMWVEVAREWAARGVPTLRLDFLGIGDADDDGRRHDRTDDLYDAVVAPQLAAALDALQARGLGPTFALAGLCSGGYWSFHGALADERVVAAMMLNPRALIWDPALDLRRDVRRALRDPGQWRKLLRRDSGGLQQGLRVARGAPRALAGMVRRGLRRSGSQVAGGDELDLMLDRLRDARKPVLLAFSGEEPLHEELERQGRIARLEDWPNVELASLPGRDHTLRPIEAQQSARVLLDRALDRLLAH